MTVTHRTTPSFDRPQLTLPRPRTIIRARGRQPVIGAEGLTAVADWLDTELQGPVTGIGGTSRGDNVVVATRDGPLLIKRYKQTVSPSMVEHEHSVLNHLEAAQFPAPRLRRSIDGSTALEHSGRWFSAFEYLQGGIHFHDYVWPPGRLGRMISDSGRALAALHTVLKGFTPTGSNPSGFMSLHGSRHRQIDWYLDLIDQSAPLDAIGDGNTSVGKDVQAFSTGVRDSLVELEAVLGAAGLPRQVVHGDYGPYNLLLITDKPIVILDFEMARTDWRITDLAKSLQQFALTRHGLRWNRLRALMDGYQSEQVLAPQEASLIPTVWEYLAMRRFIVCRHRYGETGQSGWLSKADRQRSVVEMLRANAEPLRRACSMRGPAPRAG